MTCAACLTIPPVTKGEYTLKGEYKDVAGFKTYITGSPDTKKALVGIYDIFGFTSQSLQGADLLATTLDIQVLIPDFLGGRFAQREWYAPTATDADKKEQGEFMTFAGSWPSHITKVNELISAYTSSSNITAWGGYGLCWGGKVIALTSTKDTPFKVSGQTHPGRLESKDAKEITIPHIVLASKGEDAAIVAEYKDILEGEGKNGVVETYGTQEHGWMGARANFEDEENLKEYIRGYTQFAEFFKKYL